MHLHGTTALQQLACCVCNRAEAPAKHAFTGHRPATLLPGPTLIATVPESRADPQTIAPEYSASDPSTQARHRRCRMPSPGPPLPPFLQPQPLVAMDACLRTPSPSPPRTLNPQPQTLMAVQEIQAKLPWDTLGATPEMLQTAYGSLFRALQLKSTDRLLIRGATTSVGLAATAMAKNHGSFVAGACCACCGNLLDQTVRFTLGVSALQGVFRVQASDLVCTFRAWPRIMAAPLQARAGHGAGLRIQGSQR